MTKKIIIIILLLPFVLHGQQTNDSSEIKKVSRDSDFKMKKDEFLNKFGSNDTSIALINTFFKKRKAGFIQIALLPTPILLTSLGFTIDEQMQHGSDVIMPIIAMTTAILSTAVVIPMAISGTYQVIYFSRKRLYKTLVGFKQTKTLPENMYRHIRFKKNE